MSSPEPVPAKKPCVICGNAIPISALQCKDCNSFQDYERCEVCQYAIPKGARFCKHCNAQRGWRRYLQIPQTTLSLLTALVAVASLLVTQVTNVLNRHSNTSISFVGADPDFLYVDVLNSGRSKSTVHTATLKFGELQIAPARLVFTANEKADVRKIIPAEGEARLKLQVRGLAMQSVDPSRDAILRQSILAKMNDAPVTLEFEVQESDGRTAIRSDQFSGFEIATLIEKQLSRGTQ